MVKILRLVTGEDIICHIEGLQDGIIVKSPMVIYLKVDSKTGKEILNMIDWLPKSILSKNETVLFTKDILCTMDPNDDVLEYFQHTVLDLETEEDLISDEDHLDQVTLKAELMKKFLQNMDVKEFGPIQ